MDLIILPGPLAGTVAAPASKSHLQRLLLCAALADRPSLLAAPGPDCRDVGALTECLEALGAKVSRTPRGFEVTPLAEVPARAQLPCGQSGAVLRFLLPVAAALGVEATFFLEGRLPDRPLEPLLRALGAGGASLSRPGPNRICCRGRLRPGLYTVDGGTSSQFLSGLLLALPLLKGDSRVWVTGPLVSQPYVAMTLAVLERFQAAPVPVQGGFWVRPQPYRAPARLEVEGDWSAAAFWLCARALGNPVAVTGLDPDAWQADRAVEALVKKLAGSRRTLDLTGTPDLAPPLAAAAAGLPGCTRLEGVGRLRGKESDRLAALWAMVNALGGRACQEADALEINGGPLAGGAVDARGDHRVAMAAAVAATICAGPVTILGAQCVEKSYPAFWGDFQVLGGTIERKM